MAGRGHTGSSGGAGQLVYIDEDSVKNLQQAAAAIKAMADPAKSKSLTKRMNAEIREAAEPMRRDIAEAARGLKFQRTSKAGASRSRRTGRTLKSGRFKSGRGLRESMAVGIRTQINTGRTAAGVRVRMASKDADVNRIGKVLNNRGEVKHPLFGKGENKYATRATNGRGWFYDAAYPHSRAVKARVTRVLDRWVSDLARGIDKAS